VIASGRRGGGDRLADRQHSAQGKQRAGQLDDHGERSDRLGQHDREALAAKPADRGQLFAARAGDVDPFAQANASHGFSQKDTLLAHGFDQRKPHAGQGQSQRYAGKAAAAAQVGPEPTGGGRRGGGQLVDLEQSEGVVDQLADARRRAPRARDVGAPIARQQRAVGLQVVTAEWVAVKGERADREPPGGAQASQSLVRVRIVPPDSGWSRRNSSTTARMMEMPMPPSESLTPTEPHSGQSMSSS